LQERVFQLYDMDVRTADKVIQQSKQALGTSEAHVDHLSRSLRKIISEASSALDELNGNADNMKGREKQRARAKSVDPDASVFDELNGNADNAKGREKQRGRAKSVDPKGKVPRELLSKMVKQSPPKRRVSFGEEPEKEPSEAAPVPSLPPPVPAQYQMQDVGNHTDGELQGGAVKKLCEGMSGKFRNTVSSVVSDIVDPPGDVLPRSSDGPPENFVSFVAELLTHSSISWPSNIGTHFIKTD